MKTFSIIIPHKNSIDLLNRAIKSIPKTESIEVIVVDNSDNPINNNDILIERDINIYYFSPIKGAGAARNVGIEHSHGEYIVFMDADDYFSTDINDIFENIEDVDINYFRCMSVFSDSGKKSDRANQYIKLFDNYEINPSYDNSNKIRFYYTVPWGKIYKSKLIKENHILFDEVPASNDIMFTTKASTCSKTWKIHQKLLYVVTTSEKSLTQISSSENIRSRYSVYIRHNKYLKHHGLSKYCIDLIIPLRNLFKVSLSDGLWGLSQLVIKRANLFDFIYKYIM